MATSNLARVNEEAFERRGDYEALLFEGRWIGSAELFERSRRLAGGLTALGIAPGERVVVSMVNCPEVAVVYQALWRAGAVVTPATFLLSAPDLRHVIDDSEASAVITTPDQIDKVREAVGGLGAVRHVISTGAAEDGVLGLSSLEKSDPAPIVPRSDDHLRRAALYRRHHRPSQGRDALARQPVVHGERRPGSLPRAGSEPLPDDTTAVSLLWDARHDLRHALPGAAGHGAAPVV
jgi:acyl-CoA synthetase (AMP-forming)/AMP-acid ligase II